MNLLNRLYIFFIISLAYTIYAQDCTSSVRLISSIPSAKIYINNEIAGTGETELELPMGKYIVSAIEDSLTWNPRTQTDTIEVNECSKLVSFKIEFPEKIFIQTEPPDAYVFAGDSLMGHTPLYIAATHNILKLSKPGYDDRYITLTENFDDKVILSYADEEKEPLFIKKDIFKILVGSAAVLGGLTAYFKLKADDYFEEYEFTGSKEMLNKTNQYDLVSGITFSALQINFGFLIYYFLSD